MKSSKKSPLKKDGLTEMLQNTNVPQLLQFIKGYAAKHTEFKKELLSKFGPEAETPESKKDYIKAIHHAFKSNTLKSGRGYYDQWDEFGFDAIDVGRDLKPLLKKADFYMKNGNYDAAILICCTLIETIPDEWEEEFDYDGHVQVIYDEAIDKIEAMLKKKQLSTDQIKALFDWCNKEYKQEKHKYVGLNTELEALQEFFTGTPEMLQQNLKIMDERLKASEHSFDQERAVMDKIRLLDKVKMKAEAEKTITQYLRFPDVRGLRVDDLIRKKQYTEAIDLIKEGIKIAKKNGDLGTVEQWKERLLDIYLLQRDTANILATAEDLFLDDRDVKKYYQLLKKHTPEKEWPATLERLLAGTDDEGWMGANDFKAGMLIEHNMWRRLFDLCKKGGVESLEKYEKYLKPLYAKELFDTYHRYVETQALITDPQAYGNVARVLRKMKQYEGGKEVVSQLLAKYRELYKKRPKMMEILKGI